VADVRVKFKANRSGINQACRQEGVYDDLEHRAERVIAAARASVNVVTGNYNRKLRKERFTRRGKAGVRVIAAADYALVLERGSAPHVIEPKNKQALHWPGAEHPVRRVQHPGTSGQHILRNALKAAK
jgi:hypothetical protein